MNTVQRGDAEVPARDARAVDLAPFRRTYGAFPVEDRDWPVGAEAFARFASYGPEPIGAAILLWSSDGRILLVRERAKAGKQGSWATPGGFGEAGETPEACARRETAEEAGVDARITGLTKVVVCHVAHGDLRLDYTFFQFEGEHAGGTPRPGPGIAEVRRFDRLPKDMHFRADYVEPWRRRAAP